MHVTGNAIDYGRLAALLNQSGSPLPLPELHGGLCGVICASGQQAAAGWLEGLIDDCAADPDTLAELTRELETLGRDTWQALSGWSLEFAPLLPDEDSSIDQRADALAHWCHGFLAGLVIGGIDLAGGQTPLSNELSELVRDFAEISKAGADAEEDADDDSGDRSLTELVEYVRLGAQYIFEELVAGPEAGAERTIH